MNNFDVISNEGVNLDEFFGNAAESPEEVSSESRESSEKSPVKKRSSSSSAPSSKDSSEKSPRLVDVHLCLPSEVYDYLRLCSFCSHRSMSNIVCESLKASLKKFTLPESFSHLKGVLNEQK